MNALHRAEKKGNKYQNPVPTSIGGLSTIWKALPRMLFNKNESFPKQPLGPFHTDVSVYAAPPASGLRVTWFGHSCSLVEIDGVRILIDPVWEPRASPVSFAGPKRFFAPTLAIEELPPLDAVVLSHDHYDHLGAHTVKRIASVNATGRLRWVCPLGVGKRLRSFGVPDGRIAELDWTQSVAIAGIELGTEVTVTAWPARHFSGRSLLDRFTTLWASWVIAGPRHKVLYGGDSGYWEGFAEIGQQHDRFDLTMLQVGASDPLWLDIHMDPRGAVQTYHDLGGQTRAGLLMPVHWGLFNLALHGWRAPIEETLALAAEGDIPIFSPAPGVPTEIVAGREVRSDWWKASA